MSFLPQFAPSKVPALAEFPGHRKVAWKLLLPVLLSTQFPTACTWVPTIVNHGVDAAVVVAEHRSFSSVAEDYAIKSEVDAKILDENLGLDVRADVYQGQVMLTGVVHTAAERKKAESAAKQVTAAREVFNEIQVSDENPLKVLLTGLFRQTKLKVKLIEADSVKSINYRWRAVDDVVYVLGSAADGEEMARVITIAQDINGIRKVVTHISLRSPPVAPPVRLQPPPAPPPSRRPPAYKTKVVAKKKATPPLATASRQTPR
jgi:osmotically-inducible protein OsmY